MDTPNNKEELIANLKNQSGDFETIYNNLPMAIKILSIYTLFTNFFLSTVAIAAFSANKENTSIGSLFFKSITTSYGPSNFSGDVFNQSFEIKEKREKKIKKHKKLSLIVGSLVFFIINPSLSIFFEFISRKVSKSKFFYFICSSITLIQAILSLFITPFIMISIRAFKGLINTKDQNELEKLKNSNTNKEKQEILKKNIEKRENTTKIVLAIVAIVIIFSYNVLNLIINEKLSALKKIIDKTQSQEVLLGFLTYTRNFTSLIFIYFGIISIIIYLFPKINPIIKKITHDNNKKARKKYTFILLITLYSASIGLMVFSHYINNIFNKLKVATDLGKILAYDTLKVIITISSVMLSVIISSCLRTFLISTNDSDKLLKKLLSDDVNKQHDGKNIIIKNKIIGSLFIASSAIAITSFLAILIYAEVKNLDKVFNILTDINILICLSMFTIISVITCASFYGKTQFIEMEVEKFKFNNVGESTHINQALS